MLWRSLECIDAPFIAGSSSGDFPRRMLRAEIPWGGCGPRFIDGYWTSSYGDGPFRPEPTFRRDDGIDER
jgi:hypothetical protein